MSHRLFSDGITRCRCRRRWWHTLVGAMVLLAICALIAWLYVCVADAAGASRGGAQP